MKNNFKNLTKYDIVGIYLYIYICYMKFAETYIYKLFWKWIKDSFPNMYSSLCHYST